MAMLWIDDFQQYGPGPVRIGESGYRSAFGATVVPGVGRFGLAGAQIFPTANNSGLRLKKLASAPIYLAAAYAFKVNVLPVSGVNVVLFQCGAQYSKPPLTDWTILSLILLANGSIQLRGALNDEVEGTRDGPVVQTSAPVIRAGCFHFFEVRCSFENTQFSATVLVDGVEVMSAVQGYDAPYPPVTEPDDIWLAGCPGFAKVGAVDTVMTVSDVAVLNGAGGLNIDDADDRRVYTRFPNADGADQDWTISVGASSAAILATLPPLDGQRYLAAEDPGLRVAVGTDDVASVVDISTVMTIARLWANGASAQVAVDVLSGGVETAHGSHLIGTDPTWYGDIQETDPATAAAWTASGVNAAEIIIDRTV